MPKIKVVLYRSKTYKNGTHPVMLRVTHNRQIKYYSLNANCRQEQWDNSKALFNKKYRGYHEKNRLLRILEERAYKVLDTFLRDNKPFSFHSFEQQFINEPKSITVFAFFDEIVEDLLKKEKIGNYKAYRQTKGMLEKFFEKKKLMFTDIDYRFLKKFEVFLFGNGCRTPGVHFYMRTLRAVINEAIRQRLLSRDSYPFSTQFNKAGYSLSHLKSNAVPRPLSDSDMAKIKGFSFDEYPQLARSVRYFLFSYYARGINFVDMANLKWSNIYNGRLEYIRAKTQKKYTIKLSSHLEKILLHFKGINDIYIFPILTEFHQTPMQKKNRCIKCLKHYNRDLKEVAKLLSIEVNLTSYVARHTYATTLKRKGIDISVISEGLGHSDVETTKAYLEKFSSEIIDAADEVL